MQLSDTTNQNGLVQRVERYTRRPYGSSGDELREIITDINESFADIMPLLLGYADQLKWDDLNHTDKPVGTTNLVANQNDYKITVDDNSLDILNIDYVRILRESGGTQFYELDKITAEDSRVPEILNPNTAITGKPGGYVELGNIIYLDTLPDESITNGIEIGFSRQQVYFTVTGTSGNDTTEPGIPLPFHELLAMRAALRWLMVNSSDDTNLITMLQNMIREKEDGLKDFIELRHPGRAVLEPKGVHYD